MHHTRRGKKIPTTREELDRLEVIVHETYRTWYEADRIAAEAIRVRVEAHRVRVEAEHAYIKAAHAFRG